jgi:chaperonin GroEL (HSP60 family)
MNAASVSAGLMLTTETMIADLPKKEGLMLQQCQPVAWAAWAECQE